MYSALTRINQLVLSNGARGHSNTPSSSTKIPLLTPVSLLNVIKSDGGNTIEYYAERYFVNQVGKIRYLLWNHLKAFGEVICIDIPNSKTKRWYSTHSTIPSASVHISSKKIDIESVRKRKNTVSTPQIYKAF